MEEKTLAEGSKWEGVENGKMGPKGERMQVKEDEEDVKDEEGRGLRV